MPIMPPPPAPLVCINSARLCAKPHVPPAGVQKALSSHLSDRWRGLRAAAAATCPA